MSKPQYAQRTLSPFGNPFRTIFPKHSYSSTKQLSLLSAFELTLAESIRNLIPKSNTDTLSFSWMRRAMKSLSETHISIKTFINALNFPVSDWDEKWMDLYLNNSVKVLDICNALTSELSKLNQSQLFLKYALHMLNSDDTSMARVHKSLHDYMEKVRSENPRLEKCYSVLQELASNLHLVKVKNSAKGKLLMRALYGVKVVTIFVCNIFMVLLSGCSRPLMNLEVSGDFLWAQAFNELQGGIHAHSSGKLCVIKELEVLNSNVAKFHSLSADMGKEEALEVDSKEFTAALASERTSMDMDRDPPLAVESKEFTSVLGTMEMGKEEPVAVELKELTSVLASSAMCLETELDLLSKQVEEFFELVLEGRNALLVSFMGSDVQVKGKFDKSW